MIEIELLEETADRLVEAASELFWTIVCLICVGIGWLLSLTEDE